MNDASLVYIASGDDPAADALPELTDVALVRAAVTDEGAPVPAGTEGTVVAVWGRGAAYEVEFAPPIVGLATVAAQDLRPVAARRP